MIRRNQLLYQPSTLERAMTPQGFATPDRGYHTLYEGEIKYGDYGLTAHIAYLVGGRNDGCRLTVVWAPSELDPNLFDWGWVEGKFTLPVPVLAEGLGRWDAPDPIRGIHDLIKGLASVPFTRLEELGFNLNRDGLYVHPDGWYTRSLVAKPWPYWSIPRMWGPPEDDEEEDEEAVSAFSIAEGVYLRFADGSYRLVTHREFRQWRRDVKEITAASIATLLDEPPDYRQGDLLIYISREPVKAPIEQASRLNMGRHAVLPLEGEEQLVYGYTGPFRFISGGVIRHPEHGELQLPIRQPGEFHYVIFLAPGTSRPFIRDAGDVD